MEPNLRPHQKDALRQLDNGKILWGPVGSGKTRVALAYYVRMQKASSCMKPQDLIVITTAKKRDSADWEGEAAKWVMSRDPEGTLYGKLIVDSWNNLHKYVDVADAFFVFDEQRLVGAGTWVKSFLKIAKNNFWIMLSATPGDTWLDYIPVFVANGFYKNRSEFKREHVVYNSYTKFPKVDRYLGVQKLVRLRSKILVKMPFDAHTIRHQHIVETEYDAFLMADVLNRRWNPFLDQPIASVPELFHNMRRVVNGDLSRLRALTDIQIERKRVIVFYTFDYELEMIREMAELGPFAEWNGHKHEEIPAADEWVYAVQYYSGAEGWNCIQTDTVVFWSLPFSYKLWAQAHGRIDRMDSPYIHLQYYVLKSTSMIDKAIWRALIAKRDFQTSDFEKLEKDLK
jgi:hypothetical protein